MKNPWEEIRLSDYEQHMGLESVRQLQTLNVIMKEQFTAYPIRSAMVLGAAGGNGLEHVRGSRLSTVYAVDVNAHYLNEAKKRFPDLNKRLVYFCLDLRDPSVRLPHADMVIANLLVEYIGYKCFQETVKTVSPQYVSCTIQINLDDTFVSDSPYLHAFDGLNRIHHQIAEKPLTLSMESIGYHPVHLSQYPLPNRKKLVRMDFEKDDVRAL